MGMLFLAPSFSSWYHTLPTALTLALYSAPGAALLATGRWMPEPPAVEKQKITSQPEQESGPSGRQEVPLSKGLWEDDGQKTRNLVPCPGKQ